MYKALNGHAADVRILQLPGLPEKGDVSDWLAIGGTVADLVDMTEDNQGVDQHLDFKEDFHSTGLGNTRRMYAACKGKVMYIPHFGKWFVWAGTHWQEDVVYSVMSLAKQTVVGMYNEVAEIDDDHERRAFVKWIRRSENRQRLESMISLLRSEPGISIQPENLDGEQMYLPCRNGTIDLTTGELLSSDPAHRFTKCIDVGYQPGSECPLWERFLIRIMDGDLGLVSFLQRLIGHALTGDASGKYMVFLYGPKGNNGKSTLVETVMRLLGPYAVKSPSEMIMAKGYRAGIPNDIARLRGVRFTVCNEVDSGMKLSETTVKDLTGKDTLTARFIRGEFFDFEASHKLWIYGNQRPEIRGQNPAIWDRVLLLPFNVEIPPDERDPHMADKLAQELPGILEWAIRGCLAWQRQGINPPANVRAVTQDYRSEQDLIGQFIEDCCDLDPTYANGAGSLFQVYEKWCKQLGAIAETGTKFGTELGRRGYKSQRTASIRERKGLHLNSFGQSLLAESEPKQWVKD